MERFEDLVTAGQTYAQAYTQAPWRKQLQLIGVFSLVLVFIALVAGVYLSVSARAAAAGREIQAMQAEIDNLDRDIEDLESQLAFLQSTGEMEKRVKSMGFKPVAPEEIVYLNVPGYTYRQSAVLAPVSERPLVSAPTTPPEYTESLLEWMQREVSLWTFQMGEVQP